MEIDHLIQTYPLALPLFFFLASLLLSKIPLFARYDFFGKKLNTKHLPLILITILALVFLNLGIHLLGSLGGVDDTQGVVAYAQTLAVVPLITLLYVIFVALAEEMFFRGFAYTVFGNIPSALFFAAFHLGYGSILEVLGTFLAALILNYSRKEGQSILPGFIAHVAFNLFIIFIWV
ncbi:MAG: CPBP family intramembrane metalloprotease [Candidatus Diapherotrites archaeon]|nr:CPBP family intramembrane metalloprotease [Candidatus Diapherotrites archaeon]MDZ4256293.1 CPBP family intramembrane glutamic endopeptidase [archaeon]